jgi:hypothetical protein
MQARMRASSRAQMCPTQTKGAAMGTVRALTADGLFIGQSPEFFAVLTGLPEAADAARHGS